jgi:hypothetical protein
MMLNKPGYLCDQYTLTKNYFLIYVFDRRVIFILRWFLSFYTSINYDFIIFIFLLAIRNSKLKETISKKYCHGKNNNNLFEYL